MRSHSLQSLFTFSTLLSATLAHNGLSPRSKGPVVVWVTSTITTCPSAPPPPCTDASETKYPGTTPSGYPTSSDYEATTPGGSPSSSKYMPAVPSSYPTSSTCSEGETGGSVYPTSKPTGSTSHGSSYTSSSTTSSSTTSSSSSSTTSSSTTSSAPQCTDYWLSKIKHQGIAPYAESGYKVFRNVKDYGAKGDGSSDDTAAINRAISEGGRCNPETCESTTKTPVVIYFPPGTYIVSAPIIDFYLTQIIGNPDCMPVLKASADFTGDWVIDGSLNHIWISTNIFWRQVRNFVIDLTSVPASKQISGVHWPTGQATSLQNMVFKMSTAAGTKHRGLFIEDGSGGFLNDLVFHGGAQGLAVGNQQFTMRNLTFHGCQTAIQQLWDWGWTYKGISINDCGVGLDMAAVGDTGLAVGSIIFIDSEITNTPVGIKTGKTSDSQPPSANSLILENVRLRNVATAVQGPGESTLLAGSSGQTTIAGWAQGHAYTPEGRESDLNGAITPAPRPNGLTSGTDFYERSKPQYENIPVSQFVSIRDAGAAGDGVTDDTAAINAAIVSATAAGKIVFFDYGVYVVTSTIKIPPGAKIVGEAYPIILSSGAYFNDMNNPKPVVQVSGVGYVEWIDMVVSTRGAQAGAILIEWSLSSPGTPSGMWDVHTRVSGFEGSNQLLANCPTTPNTTVTADNVNKDCIVAFMSMHITKAASNLYMENVWLWVADHDIEDPDLTRITVYAGRGLLVESTAGNIWMYGTAVEHHVLYEYQFVNTRDVVLGHIQTETAYYQPNPDATVPFPSLPEWHDPEYAPGESGLGVRAINSENILIYGAGLYSFFDNYEQTCIETKTCQSRILLEDNSSMTVYNLNTVGLTSMVSVMESGSVLDIANQADNANGFVQTLARFQSS